MLLLKANFDRLSIKNLLLKKFNEHFYLFIFFSKKLNYDNSWDIDSSNKRIDRISIPILDIT